MNISDIIGWKFDHQPDMRCKEIDGVLTITEFPGGIPSQTDQDTWAAEYDAYIASGGLVDKEEADFNFDGVMVTIAKAFHNHENRIRVLEGKPKLTLKQIIKGLRAL